MAIACSTITIDAHGEAKVLCPGVHRDRPADRAGGSGRAIGWDRRTGFGAVLQFRQFWWAAAAAAAAAAGRRLVRRRFFRAVPTTTTTTAAAGAEADRELFQGAAAGEARGRGGAQRAGARRCDGGLARLWSRGRLCRTPGYGRDP